jgi:hypothetical protein
MPRGKQTFRRTDLKRAAAVLRDLGLSLERVEIDKDGKIILVPGKPANDGGNPADEWKVA